MDKRHNPGPPAIYWRGTTIRQTWWQRWLLKLAIPAQVQQAWREEHEAQTRQPELTAAEMLLFKQTRPVFPVRPLDAPGDARAIAIRPACQRRKP